MSVRRKIIFAVILILLVLGMVTLLSTILPPGVDWETAYRPATLEFMHLRNPHTGIGFHNPAWSLIPLIPLALLPTHVGRAILFLMSLLAFGYSAYKLGAKPLALAAFIASPPVLHCLLNANIDWMPLLGFILPPQIGLFLVIIKPQVGLIVAVYWLVEAWRGGGWREVLRVFSPVTVALLLTYLVYGFYSLNSTGMVEFWWNASLWPMSIPVGLGLLAAALRTREIRYAMGAAPCLAPYVLLHSWSGALVAIVKYQFETLLVVAGLWILVALRAGIF